jgi:hypothetical protein
MEWMGDEVNQVGKVIQPQSTPKLTGDAGPRFRWLLRQPTDFWPGSR